jgi:hypothetical protein
VVSLREEYRDLDGNGTNEIQVGAAYLFEKDLGGTNNWGEVKKLVASDAAANDGFGTSVALSGTTVVIGAEFENHDGNGDGSDDADVGAAYIFERDQGGPNAWGEVKKLLGSNGLINDQFGSGVAISGDVIAVGAVEKTVGQITPGAVYLFGRNQGGANTWGEVKMLLASDGEDFDRFGRSVALSGTTLVVGAPEDDDNGEDAGSVYVLE